MTVLEVKELGKAFVRYASELQRVSSWFGYKGDLAEELWVLKGISFSVMQGESIAVLGQNGAGKSTLLKLISGTQKQSSGDIMVNGRVSAILELGLGFNSDFTGLQNAIQSLGLSGFSRNEITQLLPAVEEFAELGIYFNHPVRTYSSGMQVRLAFSLATATRPDLLIVDEALAVGDAAFQRKCFRRIEGFVESGTSLLLVSHDVELVKRLCSQAIYLSHGEIVAIGEAKQVCDLYEESLSEKYSKNEISERSNIKGSDEGVASVSEQERDYGDRKATIISVQIQDESANVITVINENHPISVVYKVKFDADCNGVEFGMMLKTVDGVPVYGSNTIRSDSEKAFKKSEIARVVFNLAGNLMPGVYYLNVGVTHKNEIETAYLHRRIDCIILRILGSGMEDPIGYANLFAEKSVRLIHRRGHE